MNVITFTITDCSSFIFGQTRQTVAWDRNHNSCTVIRDSVVKKDLSIVSRASGKEYWGTMVVKIYTFDRIVLQLYQQHIHPEMLDSS